MIGEIEALIDQGVDIDRPVLSRALRECSSMFLTIASARLPCCTTLSRLPCSVSSVSVISARILSSSVRAAEGFPQFVDQLDRDRREIVDEVERVLDLVRDASGQLT